MRVLVTMQRHPDAAALIDDVRCVGYKIQAAKPVGRFTMGAVRMQRCTWWMHISHGMTLSAPT